jgi:hypothetical protein
LKVFYFAVTDVASTRYSSFAKERYKSQMQLEGLNWLSLPNKEICLDEFCRIRKSENLTIETYHAMRKCEFHLIIL